MLDYEIRQEKLSDLIKNNMYVKVSERNEYKKAILATKSMLHSTENFDQDFIPSLLKKMKKSNKKSEAYRQALYDSLKALVDDKANLPSKKRLELAVNLASNLNISLPSGIVENWKICANFINEAIKKK